MVSFRQWLQRQAAIVLNNRSSDVNRANLVETRHGPGAGRNVICACWCVPTPITECFSHCHKLNSDVNAIKINVHLPSSVDLAYCIWLLSFDVCWFKQLAVYFLRPNLNHFEKCVSFSCSRLSYLSQKVFNKLKFRPVDGARWKVPGSLKSYIILWEPWMAEQNCVPIYVV